MARAGSSAPAGLNASDRYSAPKPGHLQTPLHGNVENCQRKSFCPLLKVSSAHSKAVETGPRVFLVQEKRLRGGQELLVRNKAVMRDPRTAEGADKGVHPGELGFMLRFLCSAGVLNQCSCASVGLTDQPVTGSKQVWELQLSSLG